jgi:activator of HSP90 ATPase
MAKLGEGDERWIVSERDDGANVNNWHWQEKDAFEWAREKFASRLALTIADAVPDPDDASRVITIKTSDVTALTGEAYVNRRKGKIIAGYELDLKMKYDAEARSKDDPSGDVVAAASGNVHFPYIADENAGEEHDAKVLNAKNGALDDRVKEIIRTVGLPMMWRAISEIEKELAAGGPGGEGDAPAPKPSGGGKADFRDGANVNGGAKSDADREKESRSDKTAPLSRKAHALKMTERFFCRPRDICDALLDGGRVMHFSRSPADVKPAPGPFTMFDGNVHGETLEYVPGELIRQKWRFRNWAEGHFSEVTITFRCVLYKSFSPIARFQHLIASPFN